MGNYFESHLEPKDPMEMNVEEKDKLKEHIVSVEWKEEDNISKKEGDFSVDLKYKKANYSSYAEGPDEDSGILGKFPPLK